MPANEKASVERLRKEIEAPKGTPTWTGFVTALRLISQVVFTRSSGFILELIQNAEDSGLTLPPRSGEVCIFINERRLKFLHNGKPFEEKNLQAMCNINSSKRPEQGTLGYLGIGFKSVFKVTDCVEIYSNGFQFKFDRNHSEWAGHISETPWQVIPIWIETPTEEIEPAKTIFIIRFKDGNAANHVRDSLKLLRAELYLFLKWITKIQIIDELSGDATMLENSPKEGDITVLKHGNRTDRFRFFNKEVAVPDWVKQDQLTQEYRANVTKREIAIAFAVDENQNLNPSSAPAMYGGVYSFLPLAESKSGAKFPIQADFLVQPGRDAINYEAPWNRWLLDEVKELSIEAIKEFQQHPMWKFQYLAAFEFAHSDLDAYKYLFGPHLIEPVETFLEENPCIPTTNGDLAKPDEIVCVTESETAVEALVEMKLMAQNEIAQAFSGKPNAKLADSRVSETQFTKAAEADRWKLFGNEDFLKQKAASKNAGKWFRQFYCWLNRFPAYEEYFYYRPRRRPRTYHTQEIVLAADGQLLRGGQVSLLDEQSDDAVISALALELQKTKPMLHPDVLNGSIDTDERDAIKGFLTGFCGVQKLDTKTVCREAILKKILTDAPLPEVAELISYTTYCCRHPFLEMPRGSEIWVATKSDNVRPAREVFFSSEFRPPQNWEINQRYVNGLRYFVSPEYLKGCETDEDFKKWREFFRQVGVQESPDNGVENFAMNFAMEKLQSQFSNIEPVDHLNFGYDLKAQSRRGEPVHIEVKGLSSDRDIELTGNEADAADRFRDSFYLCVVSTIPNLPKIRLVQNPALVGKKDKLLILAADWQAGQPVA
jgi:hypothetical protein